VGEAKILLFVGDIHTVDMVGFSWLMRDLLCHGWRRLIDILTCLSFHFIFIGIISSFSVRFL